ncbi:MAG: NADH-quinone oxidoreductase subunit J [Anaerolineales bacterium]|nr:NADH-quinone oxidoreductase subunit J [Anaerolineales bacterium]MCX7607840.1 NADH-quinone oxidoreductase subunit J [Anaerolineales bacterium]MDW8226537.1 NADH-quinone oxidoreductase subunit J [Anaerolineales bacterium]
MTVEQILFLLAGAVILVSAFLVVTVRKLMHAALWLVVTLFGVAVLYALLQANFLAVVQLVVYIGAIAILFIFAVMLTRKEMRDLGPQTRSNWWVAVLVGAAVLMGLVFVVLAIPGVERTAQVLPEGLDTVQALGVALVSPNAYVLPFEVASVLLLAALIGAVYLAGIIKK